MVSTRQPSQAEQVASNAWLRAAGGCIFADAPNAVTSAAVTPRQISMHRNITPLRVTRSSRASSPARSGFTTIVQKKPSPAQSFTLLTVIRWINLCPDRPARCLHTGKRCLTNSGRLFASAASRTVRSRRHKVLAGCCRSQRPSSKTSSPNSDGAARPLTRQRPPTTGAGWGSRGDSPRREGTNPPAPA